MDAFNVFKLPLFQGFIRFATSKTTKIRTRVQNPINVTSVPVPTHTAIISVHIRGKNIVERSGLSFNVENVLNHSNSKRV